MILFNENSQLNDLGMYCMYLLYLQKARKETFKTVNRFCVSKFSQFPN